MTLEAAGVGSRQDGAAEPARRLLIGVCGAANVLSLPAYVLALRADPRTQIKAVMTRSAAAILPPASLRLLCDEVHCDGVDDLAAGHVHLAEWAQRFIVLPTTANMLGQVANGLASGILSSALLAYGAPAVFFPSMNLRMWEQPSVRRNVARVRDDGHIVVEPVPTDGWEVGSSAAGEACAPCKGVGLPSPGAVAAMVAELRRIEIGGR
jgi:phosphopantothenoylcysteine synthetase/decarboxylase